MFCPLKDVSTFGGQKRRFRLENSRYALVGIGVVGINVAGIKVVGINA